MTLQSQSVAFCAILNHGYGNKALKIAKAHGTSGGTLVLCEGTVSNSFLQLMGLDESKKELLITLAPKDKEDEVHCALTEGLHLNKKGVGILFSSDTSSVYGSRLYHHDFEENEQTMGNYQLLVTIVDRDKGDEVVDAARRAGAKGATILHGRGIGTAETAKLFYIEMQPEKEVVLLVVESEKVDHIATTIKAELQLDLPGKGVTFSIPVNAVSGLVQDL
ncbi:P-II family nitrogen regulator [Aerococcus sp. 1KP-2016]|uniref:P-II family nitrogen regulator n=1 Tax=Aerococcus sp. 1KP-2016 TaxID=1981982 RepID=UPI000B98EA88|nr:P-II family nitrogen regulator [Aerococcus sp. 1KP-2016]OYQ68182.1 P-II family nitrogen regulator [Aerococcus sp. 1KP-2016]